MNIRICNSVVGKKKDSSNVGCQLCDARLNCTECNRVECLGRNELHFCSHSCSDMWSKIQMNKKKLRNFIWLHPFRSIALLGALISVSSAYILAWQYLKPLFALTASGILTVLIAFILYFIGSE